MTFILSIPIEIRLAVLFVVGCCLGGLINLGIYRLAWNPRPVSPWSRPPAEAPRRRPWDRIPVFGWFGLRRESKLYGDSFWVWARPMLVELFCGAAIAGLYYWEIELCRLVPPNLVLPKFFLPAILPNNVMLATIRHEQFLAHAVLLCFMLVATWIDIDETNIPDGITVPCTLLGLLIVSLWPYALLPQVNSGGPWGAPVISAVWLTSPDDIPPPLNNPLAPPQFVNPWDVNAVTGPAALAAAVAVFWTWCLALLLPDRWRMRRGFRRAIGIYAARIVRQPGSKLMLALAVIGAAAIAGVWWHGGPRWAALASSLAGIAVGGGLVWIIRVLASMAMGREAMGFGDVTLLAMIGAFLGWQATIVVFFMAPLIALVFGIVRLLLHGEQAIPFGPFLCPAAAITVIYWPPIWDFLGDHYFSLHWWLIVVLLGCLSLMVVLLPPIRWVTDRLRRTA